MKRVLIDTNIYSELLRGNRSVANLLKKPDIIAFSVISIAELLSGFKNGGREKENLEELDQFIYSPRVVIYDIDSETSEFYAKIYDELKRSGDPIPTNDLWIAALALQHGTKLFTMDKHFKKVRGLFLIMN
ncbi:MAG: type II toxin-antitoxin system VapC family toxin [Actinobacteria bacterium]|nr:type II toxin-antitoxin system VapC family toxin [Actinomycetota bacterium]